MAIKFAIYIYIYIYICRNLIVRDVFIYEFIFYTKSGQSFFNYNSYTHRYIYIYIYIYGRVRRMVKRRVPKMVKPESSKGAAKQVCVFCIYIYMYIYGGGHIYIYIYIYIYHRYTTSMTNSMGCHSKTRAPTAGRPTAIPRWSRITPITLMKDSRYVCTPKLH